MSKKQQSAIATKSKKGIVAGAAHDKLLHDLRLLIDGARTRVAQQINTELVMLNWHMGKRISAELEKGGKPEYGSQLLEKVAIELTAEYGRGFDRSALSRIVRLVEVFPDEKIFATLSQKLGWSHFKEIVSLENPLQRNFYAEMCRVEGWSVRTLRDKIRRKLFERTAIAKKPEDVAEEELKLLRERGELSPDLVFRDPYLLDFLGLTGAYDEKDVENAILRELEQFILELGSDFCFVARQKRMSVDFDDYYLDLLFYHRGLRRLVAIELKLDAFKPEHKGQMEFYLRWLEQNERRPHEESPIGLILCAGKSAKKVELMSLHEVGIRVAEYFTEVLPEDVLAAKLHEAIGHAQERLNNQGKLKKIGSN
ncbi:MAG: PDDEXK nuclease domain-containing protein [Candidatus Obscuribacterales bacterium]|mgnify:CR=1 FL=1|nr:PDDEXK nuclease domain-containing protein [Candidatus Obscuribacterales bacterium]